MKRDSEKERLMEQGDLEFWNETVVYYRNRKDKAKTVADFVENFQMLQASRKELARVERRILGNARAKVLIMVVLINVLVLVTIVCSSCQTAKGMMGDTAWILKTTADNIQVQE